MDVVDSFLKSFRTEFNQRTWFLNNTLLEPENLSALTYKNSAGTSVTYFAFINGLAGGFAVNRFNYVNTQVALGTFYKPTRPTNTTPVNGTGVLPGVNFAASAYAYNAAYTHTAAAVTSPHTKTKWEIRSSADTYDNPVYIFTNTVAPLISLATCCAFSGGRCVSCMAPMTSVGAWIFAYSGVRSTVLIMRAEAANDAGVLQTQRDW